MRLESLDMKMNPCVRVRRSTGCNFSWILKLDVSNHEDAVITKNNYESGSPGGWENRNSNFSYKKKSLKTID